MKTLFFILTIIVSISSSKAQILGFQLDNNAKKVEIPFEIYNNLIVIPVVINDRLPLKFVLDTGVRTSILTEKAYASLIGLSFTKEYTIGGLGEGRYIKAYISNNISLKLPGVSGRGHSLLVLDEDYLELRNYLGAEVSGVLGYELFSRFIVKIDYDRKQLTLYKPERFRARRSWLTIPMSVEDTKPYVYGKAMYYGGKEVDVKLLVDTGASHGLILYADSSEHVTIPEKHIQTSVGRGLAGRLEGRLGRLRAFQMGGACWEDIVTTFPESDPWMDSLMMSTIDRDGSIGGDLLSRFRVIFNFPLEEMYVKKGRTFRKDFTYNLSGITVKAIGSELNTYEVVEVRENSVAEEADIRVGDRIVSINGRNAADVSMDYVIGLLNSKPKQTLRLKLLRDEEEISKRIELRMEI